MPSSFKAAEPSGPPFPTVAVILSVYRDDDDARFDRALKSLENQDYGGEVRIYLFVDGPIGDDLERVISAHRAQIYKLLRSPVNLGLAVSMNRLLQNLEYEEFVFRMDSDDFSHVCRVSRQVEVMTGDPTIDILGAGIAEVDDDQRVLKVLTYPKKRSDIFRIIPMRNPMAHVTVCFRRSAIEKFQYYPITSINQDWALWFRCLRLNMHLANIDDVLVDVTVSDKFLKRRGPSRAAEELRISLRGIRQTHGLTWRMVYPLFRFIFRYSPYIVKKAAYGSRFR